MDPTAATKRDRAAALENIRRLRQKRKRLERVGRGCGLGCLTAFVALFALPGAWCWSCGKWSDVRPFLAAVRPGMTEEEVLALVPKRFETHKRKANSFFEDAIVVVPGPRPESVLLVRVKEKAGALQTFGLLAGVSDAAWVYFDAGGRVVGEDYSARSPEKTGKWKRNRPWGVPFGKDPWIPRAHG